MTAPDYDEHYDFLPLIPLDIPSLLTHLADVHTTLANLHARVGFLKAEKVREPQGYSAQELPEAEAKVRAYEEKKWLIVALLRNWNVDGS